MIRTSRLILRPWQPSDLPLFAEQNADPLVMRFLGGVLTREESDAYAARAMQHLAANGFCKWAVEAPDVASFIGAIGLTRVSFEALFTPAVEVAWGLPRRYWRQGFATEAAAAALHYGFDSAGLRQIVAMTALDNTASRRVMQRIAMSYALDFDHPKYTADHPLCRHCLFTIERAAMAAGNAGADA